MSELLSICVILLFVCVCHLVMGEVKGLNGAINHYLYGLSFVSCIVSVLAIAVIIITWIL